MLRNSLLKAGVTTLAALGLAAAVPAQAQTLYVSQVGDGTVALTNAATVGSLDLFKLDGTSAGTSIALPSTATASGNRALTFSGTATSEGQLGLAPDGVTLTIFGYNATAGTTGVAATTSANVNRVVGLINTTTGTIDSTTALSDAASGNNPRSAATDGTNIYVAGGAGGVRQTTDGATTSTAISGTLANARVVNLFGGNIYASSGSGAFVGVNQIAGGTATLIAADTTGKSPYDFVFTNANTLYVADDATSASGGLLQYTNSGSGFTLTNTYNLALASDATKFAGLRGLTYDGSGTFYAISTDNRLVSFNGTSFSTLATAATNTAFRGVEFVPAGIAAAPEPSGMVALAIGAGVLGLMVARRRKQIA